ncbi:MAG TPA: hypothetical protein VHC63_15570 [Acidimicrobiales bacterium]|nr:hypothetical protein [Acidimicrobiales bacterium]
MRRRLPVLLAALGLGAAAFGGFPTSAGAAAGRPEFITGTGDRSPADVELYDAGGNRTNGFYGFGGASTGARVAAGDVDGDLQPDVVLGTGAGVASQVAVYSQTGVFMGSFSPYGGFAGGVNVGVGDVDGDTVDEIVTAADAGGGPHVIVWDWNTAAHTATAKYGWYAYDPNFHGGVSVSVADVVGSGRADVVTAPGAGGGPHVIIWDLGSGAPVASAQWMAYAPGFTGGVRVSAGDIDGARAVVTGAGPGGGPHVRLFSTNGAVKSEFMAYSTAYHGGVNVLLSTAQGGDLGHIITAPASWGGPHIRAFTSSGSVLWEFMAYNGVTMNGVRLGRIPQLGSSNNVNQGGSNSSVSG